MTAEAYLVLNTRRFEESVRFYRQQLGLPTLLEWDHGPENLGARFAAGSAAIEIIHWPPQGPLADEVAGIGFTIEVDDIEERYDAVRERGAPIALELELRPWGQRQFAVRDPNGLLLFFSER